VNDEPAPQPTWKGAAEKVYTNAVAISGGPFDVTLVFGLQQQERPDRPGDRPAVEEVVRVSMSWGHAKSMIPLLARVVADYESKVGEIPAPGFENFWRE
jgi:hypothetical protein